MRISAVMMVAALAGVARADDEHFLGWSPDGTFWAMSAAGCANQTLTLCRSSDAPPTWPARYGTVEGDGACIDGFGSDVLRDAPEAEVRALVVGGRSSPMGPGGATVSLKANRKAASATITIKSGKLRHVETVADLPKAKLDGSFWSSDGRWLAVAILAEHPSSCDAGALHVVKVLAIGDLALPGTGAGAGAGVGDRKAASAANVKGMGLYKKRQWKAAMAAFQLAIKADDSFVLPHYNLASVASLTGDLELARRELAKLAESKDPEAQQKLVKATSNPDLDYASTDPAVRRLIGMAAYPSEGAGRLVERSGVWSAEGKPCQLPAMTMVFDDGPVNPQFRSLHNVKLTLSDDCKGKHSEESEDEEWDNADPLALSPKGKLAEIVGDSAVIAWQRCAGSQVAGSCFSVKNLGVFHRGLPELRK